MRIFRRSAYPVVNIANMAFIGNHDETLDEAACDYYSTDVWWDDRRGMDDSFAVIQVVQVPTDWT